VFARSALASSDERHPELEGTQMSMKNIRTSVPRDVIRERDRLDPSASTGVALTTVKYEE
jgi:hypothetical protein